MGGEHICPICFATFTRPQHVGRHMRSHTGDKPYGCPQCPDRFARSDLLSRHVQKTHGDGLPAKPRKSSKTSTTSSNDNKPKTSTPARRSSDGPGHGGGQNGGNEDIARRASGSGTVWGPGMGQGQGQGQVMRQGMGYGPGQAVGDGREQGYAQQGSGNGERSQSFGGMGPQQLLMQQYQAQYQLQQQQLMYGQAYDPRAGVALGAGGVQYQELEIDEEEDDWEDMPGGGGMSIAGPPHFVAGQGFLPTYFHQLPGASGAYTQPQSRISPASGNAYALQVVPSVLDSSPIAAYPAAPSPGHPSRESSLTHPSIVSSPMAHMNNIPFNPTPLLAGSNGYLVPSPLQGVQQSMGMPGSGVGYHSASPEAMAMMMSGSTAVDSPGPSYLSLPGQPGSGLQSQFGLLPTTMMPSVSDSGSAYLSAGYPYVSGGLQESPIGYADSLSPISNPGGTSLSERSTSTSNVILGHLPPEGSIAIVPPPNGMSMRGPLMKKHRACEQCNHSKVKCDFGAPCHKCAARGLSCTYPSGRKVSAARAAKQASNMAGSSTGIKPIVAMEGIDEGLASGHIAMGTLGQMSVNGLRVSPVPIVKTESSTSGHEVVSAQDMARLADGRRASITGPLPVYGQVNEAFAPNVTMQQPNTMSIDVGQAAANPYYVGTQMAAIQPLQQTGHTSLYRERAIATPAQEHADLHGGDDSSDSFHIPTASQSRRTSLASSFLEEAAAMALGSTSDLSILSAPAQHGQFQPVVPPGSAQSANGRFDSRIDPSSQPRRPGAERMPSLQDVKDAWRTYLAGPPATTEGAQHHLGAHSRTSASPTRVDAAQASSSTNTKTRPGLIHRGRSSSTPPVFLNPNTMSVQVGMSGLTPRAGPDQQYDFGQFGGLGQTRSAVNGHGSQELSTADWNRWNQGLSATGHLGDDNVGGGYVGSLPQQHFNLPTSKEALLAGYLNGTRPVAGVLQQHANLDLQRQMVGKGVAQTLAPERAPSFNLISPAVSEQGPSARLGSGTSPLRPGFPPQPQKTTSLNARPGTKRLASQTLVPEHFKIQGVASENPGMTTSGSWDSMGSGPITPTTLSIHGGRRSSVPGWVGSYESVATSDPSNATKSMVQPYPFTTPNLLDSMNAEYGFPGVDFATPTTNGQFSFAS